MTSRNIYDNWERLVEAVIRREQIWQLCHASSSSSPTICSDDSSDFSFPSPVLLPPDPPKHHLSSNSSTFSQPVNKPELHSPASRSTELPNVFLEIDKELKMRGHHLRKIRTGASTLSIANRCHGIESQQSRSPSVVARLMGLDPLPDSSTSKPEKLSLIRRKISHSRSVAEEIEIRLKMRGFDKQSKDLVALKQILEALQLKGLLQSGVPAVEPKSTKLLTLYEFDMPSKDLVALKQILEVLHLKGFLQSEAPAVEPKSTERLTL